MGKSCERKILVGLTGNQNDQELARQLNKDINRFISYSPDWPGVDVLKARIPLIRETSRISGTVEALRIVNGIVINGDMQPSRENDPVLNFLFNCGTTPRKGGRKKNKI